MNVPDITSNSPQTWSRACGPPRNRPGQAVQTCLDMASMVVLPRTTPPHPRIFHLKNNVSRILASNIAQVTVEPNFCLPDHPSIHHIACWPLLQCFSVHLQVITYQQAKTISNSTIDLTLNYFFIATPLFFDWQWGHGGSWRCMTVIPRHEQKWRRLEYGSLRQLGLQPLICFIRLGTMLTEDWPLRASIFYLLSHFSIEGESQTAFHSIL